jgi:predicted nucleic acid-binding Zn finger protein
MLSTALEYAYRYPFSSDLVELPKGTSLDLATSNCRLESPQFFEGRVKNPREMGLMLNVLTKVVRTHFFLPVPAILDPVVTSNKNILRFEGFSGCCGVYARADFPSDGFDCDVQRTGTTNVDFNDQMRNALNRLSDNSATRLSVGRHGVELESDDSIFEKKVKLPIRWVKGFSEVQVLQTGMNPIFEIPGNEALKFFRSIPQVSPKKPSYLVKTGNALRLSQRNTNGSVRISGTHRIKILEPLMRHCEVFRVWSDDTSSIVGMEVVLSSGRFFLLLSSEPYRGFSGEGQVLTTLMKGKGVDSLPLIQAALKWDSTIDTKALSNTLDLQESQVDDALIILGSRGLAGYDLHESAYFHRELPFDMEKIEQLQPRLLNARKLVAENKVRLTNQKDSQCVEFEVIGTDINHLVRIRPDGDKCTCLWFAKHLGQRGPCKHVLAAQILLDEKN